MLTKNALGNLINRYKAVLKKCNLLNTFGSLAVTGMLVAGSAGGALAVPLDVAVDGTDVQNPTVTVGDSLGTVGTPGTGVEGDILVNIGPVAAGDFVFGTGTSATNSIDATQLGTFTLTLDGDSNKYLDRVSTTDLSIFGAASAGDSNVVIGDEKGLYLETDNANVTIKGVVGNVASLTVASNGSLVIANGGGANTIGNTSNAADGSFYNIDGAVHSINTSQDVNATSGLTFTYENLTIEDLTTNLNAEGKIYAQDLFLAGGLFYNNTGSAYKVDGNLAANIYAAYATNIRPANTVNSLSIGVDETLATVGIASQQYVGSVDVTGGDLTATALTDYAAETGYLNLVGGGVGSEISQDVILNGADGTIYDTLLTVIGGNTIEGQAGTENDITNLSIDNGTLQVGGLIVDKLGVDVTSGIKGNGYLTVETLAADNALIKVGGSVNGADDASGFLFVADNYTETGDTVMNVFTPDGFGDSIETASSSQLQTVTNFSIAGEYSVTTGAGTIDDHALLHFSDLTINPNQIVGGNIVGTPDIELSGAEADDLAVLHVGRLNFLSGTLGEDDTNLYANAVVQAEVMNVLDAGQYDGTLTVDNALSILGSSADDTVINAASVTVHANSLTFDAAPKMITGVSNLVTPGGTINANLIGGTGVTALGDFVVNDGKWILDSDNTLVLNDVALIINNLGVFRDTFTPEGADGFTSEYQDKVVMGSTAAGADDGTFYEGTALDDDGQIVVNANGEYYAENLTFNVSEGHTFLELPTNTSDVSTKNLWVTNDGFTDNDGQLVEDGDDLTIVQGAVRAYESVLADVITVGNNTAGFNSARFLLGGGDFISGGNINAEIIVDEDATGDAELLVTVGTWIAHDDITITDGSLNIYTDAVLNTSGLDRDRTDTTDERVTLTVDATNGTVLIADRGELIAHIGDFGTVDAGLNGFTDSTTAVQGIDNVTVDSRLVLANMTYETPEGGISLEALQNILAGIDQVEGAGSAIALAGATELMTGVIRIDGLTVNTKDVSMSNIDNAGLQFNFSLPNNTLEVGTLGDAAAGNAYHVEVSHLVSDSTTAVDSVVDAESYLGLLGGSLSTMFTPGDITLNDAVDVLALAFDRTRLTLGTGYMQGDVIFGNDNTLASVVNTELIVVGNATVGNLVQGDGGRTVDSNVEGDLEMANGASLSVLGSADVQTIDIENSNFNTVANLYVAGNLTVGDDFTSAVGTDSTTGYMQVSGTTTVVGELTLHMWGNDSQTTTLFLGDSDYFYGDVTVGSLVLNPEVDLSASLPLWNDPQILHIVGNTTVTTGGINGDFGDLNEVTGTNHDGTLENRVFIFTGNTSEQGNLHVTGESDLVDITSFAASKWNPVQDGNTWQGDLTNASTQYFHDGFENNATATTIDNELRGNFVMGQNSIGAVGQYDNDRNSYQMDARAIVGELVIKNPYFYDDLNIDGVIDTNPVLWGYDFNDVSGTADGNANNLTAALYVAEAADDSASINLDGTRTDTLADVDGNIIVDGSIVRTDVNGKNYWDSASSRANPIYTIVATDKLILNSGEVREGSAVFATGSLFVVDANGVRGDVTPDWHRANSAGDDTVLSGPGNIMVENEVNAPNQPRLHVREGYAGQELDFAFTNAQTVDNSFWLESMVTTDTALLKAVVTDTVATDGNATITLNPVLAKDAFPLFTNSMAHHINTFMYESGLDYNSENADIRFMSRAVSYNYGLNGANLGGAAETVKVIESAAQMGAVGGVAKSTMNALFANADATLGRSARSGLAGDNDQLVAVNMDDNNNVTSGMSAGDGTDGMKNGVGLWLMPLYKWNSTSGFEGGNFDGGYDSGLGGLALGADYTINSMFRIGLNFNLGAGNTTSTGDFSETTNDFDFWGVGLYAAFQKGGFGLMADVGYTASHNELTQDVPSSMEMGDNDADISASAWTAALNAEYVFKTSALDIIPHIGVRFASVTTGDYDVNNGGTVFNVESDTQDVWYFPLGITFQKDIQMDGGTGGWHLTPKLDLGVLIASGDLEAVSETGIPGISNHASLEMQNVDGFAFNGGLGLDFGNENLTFGVNYNIMASENEIGHMVFGTFRYKF